MPHDSVGTRRAAVCTLILTCACALTARAGAQSTSSTAPKKPATGSASATRSPSHRAGAKSSGTSKGSSQATGAARSSTATHSTRRSTRKRVGRVRGQQKIDSERARSIQQALIRERYLSGEATGKWDQASEEAMRRYQSDHGWQTKEVPDSRALIKLGLGPSNDHLLNPESAMTTAPDMPRSESASPAQHPAPTQAPTQTPAPADAPSPQ